MGHPIQGIKGSKPRFGPTLRQIMAQEAAREERKRQELKLRKSAKAAPGKAQKPAPAARKSDK